MWILVAERRIEHRQAYLRPRRRRFCPQERWLKRVRSWSRSSSARLGARSAGDRAQAARRGNTSPRRLSRARTHPAARRAYKVVPCDARSLQNRSTLSATLTSGPRRSGSLTRSAWRNYNR